MTNPPPDVTRFSDDSSNEESTEFELSGTVHSALALPCQLGEYQVLSLLGSGGMGQVYRAEHRRMARPVALKTLRPDLIQNPKAVERFYAEVRAAARVLHPNLVVAFDAGEADSVHYLAMELIEGENLAQNVSSGGPLGEAEAVKLIRSAAFGLQAAHNAGIVHRDVKPSNLMKTFDGSVKVLDLGLATVVNELSHHDGHGKLIGTVEFIAPEQLYDPDHVDARADIYSLGATFFYLLVGRPPFEGSLFEQLRAHRDEEPPELYRFRHDADLRLDHIVRRMLAKRPEQRYQNMQEVIDELEPLLSSVGTSKPLRDSSSLATDINSTVHSLSTSMTKPAVLGVDLGLYYAAAAIAESDGTTRSLAAGGSGRPLMRCAVASDGKQISIGEDAMKFRVEAPEKVTHCIQVYLGRPKVDRILAGRRLPPEVWLGLVMRQLFQTVRTPTKDKIRPTAVALTIPACYDQLHRRSIMQAAQIAGLPAPRLVDRPLAAAASQLNPKVATLPIPDASKVCHWLVVSVAGNAMEVAVLRHLDGRFQMLASTGSVPAGIPAWHQRIADLVANDCKRKTGQDPRKNLATAVALQIACEQTLRSLLLKEKAELRFTWERRQVALMLTRDAVKAACQDLLGQLEAMVREVFTGIDAKFEDIERCLLIGTVGKLSLVQETIKRNLIHEFVFQPIDQGSLACGAAIVGGGGIFESEGSSNAHMSCSNRDLGVLVRNEQEGRKAVNVLPRFSVLPTQAVRRLRWSSQTSSDEFAIVESAGWQGAAWRSLGTHRPSHTFTGGVGELSLAVDSSGILNVRLRDPSSGRSETVGPFPATTLSDNDCEQWKNWVEEALLTI